VFGYSVSLSADGNTALIGADTDNPGPPRDLGGRELHRPVLERRSHSRGPTACGRRSRGSSPTPPTEKDAQFGSRVALSDNGRTALIFGSAPWVFTRSGSGWSDHPAKLPRAGDPLRAAAHCRATPERS